MRSAWPKVVVVGTFVLVLLVLLVLLVSGATWTVQDWRYGEELAVQAGLHQNDLTAISEVDSAHGLTNQESRLALKQRLLVLDQTHYKEMSDTQTKQARLRDRLATADLRLSVLLAEDSAGGCSVSAGAGGVVHGAARARLVPAHAQRIIAITDTGDPGLIALQAYVSEVSAVR